MGCRGTLEFIDLGDHDLEIEAEPEPLAEIERLLEQIDATVEPSAGSVEPVC
jgi:hypothetical protein